MHIMTKHCQARLVLLIVVLLAAASAMAGDSSQRVIAPAVVVMDFPPSFGGMERPAVEFDHAAHTAALEGRGCETCHPIDQGGALQPVLTSTVDAGDRDRLIDAYHNACMGCHRERSGEALSAGPLTCGDCHTKRTAAVSARLPMSFDYSLHGRHAIAFQDKCENCHHVFDEAAQKLRYEKGKEESCRSCHGEVDQERTPSLANAAHRACVSCHLRRSGEGLETGPTECAGCHDEQGRMGIEELEVVPRLVRGQPDRTWIHGANATSPMVAFDHEAHEGLTTSCSTCHHQTLRACDGCHTLTGSREGALVTTSQSYHLQHSEHSCVGCHSNQTADASCAGCHSSLGAAPAQASCAVCHSGPLPNPETVETEVPPPHETMLAVLPEYSKDFPETVVINGLADRYGESVLPHAKILAKLDGIVRDSELAVSFHRETETLCSGCHHNSPAGTRPPPCRSCHAEMGAATHDQPGLKVAYHRQCIGCHKAMNLPQQGCTDCHAAKTEEVES